MKEVLEAFHNAGGLIIIRNQEHIDPYHLCQFVKMFGDLEKNEKYDSQFLVPGYPEILRIGNSRKAEKYSALFIEADPPPLLWHMDDSFRNPQPIGSCMFCLHTPPEGGETGFAGMTAAYEALPKSIKNHIESIQTIHSYNYLNEQLRIKNPHRPSLSKQLRKQIPSVKRPLVATHPETKKKCLYLPLCHIESVIGIEDSESKPLLNNLLDHAISDSFAYMHSWMPGDVVVWDNRCTLHAPTPFDHNRYERLMYRLTFLGDQILGS